MQNTLSAQDLAKKTTEEVMKNLQSDDSETLLNALEKHYEVLGKTQEIHIEFLGEFVKNLKNLQKKDKESMDNLKKKVLSHVLKSQSN